MKCIHPQTAFILGHKDNGKAIITFSFNEAQKVLGTLSPHGFSVPCGKCGPCLIRRRQDMTVRLMKECDHYHGNATFLTLTYDDEHMPFVSRLTGEFARGKSSDPVFIQSLYKRDIQAFLKKLRRQLEYHYNIKNVRFACCGEYGKSHIRPHWHLILFGFVPGDLVMWKRERKYVISRSPFIERLWKYGFSTVGTGNGAVARYCAKYLLKDGVPLEKCQVPQCFWTSKMSGGIGLPWFKEFFRECLANHSVSTLDRTTGKIFNYSIPKYFLQSLKKFAPTEYEKYLVQVQEFISDQNQLSSKYWHSFFKAQKAKVDTYFYNATRESRSYESLS